MSAQADLQAFLRFLTKDAKVPLATALGKVKQFQAAGLPDAVSIASATPAQIREIFDTEDEAADKLAKQVHSAAKRTTKRKAPDESAEAPSARKKQKKKPGLDASPAEIEEALTLPEPSKDLQLISETVLVTNRAPLVLAFAVILLKYTMPEQPLSSRLSLAQAVVSMNSKSKAVSLGIDSGQTAEDEGWGQGQPGVRIMGREIKTMKRWGYDPSASREDLEKLGQEQETAAGKDEEPPLWGLDLEALKKTGGPSADKGVSKLPVHAADSARAYLLKSFASAAKNDSASSEAKSTKAKRVVEEKEQNLGLLLGALDALFGSWAHLDQRELDRRAWAWYVRVRPDVEHGPSGWGNKGEVLLKSILDLRRSE
ncbi:hypothetical protein FH972_021669 [Carpinus fangiana]|uniref:Impact N-terminal domain-containing protein n=1 Tax=Carpinus fangiana TaxID=176857 RepID=A0A5N6KQM5_9ROSI|nr:hypothetical protein FH972_021669 [Carpinus fangiana]